MVLRKKSRKVNNKNKNKRIRKSRRNRRCRKKVGGGGFKVGQTVYYKKGYYDDIHMSAIPNKIHYTVTYKITKINNDDKYDIICENNSDLLNFNSYISKINSEIEKSNNDIRRTDSGPSGYNEYANTLPEKFDLLSNKIENVPFGDLTLVPTVNRKVVKK